MVPDHQPNLPMKICRFNQSQVGLVLGDEVLDVTSVTERLGARKWPFPRHDVFIENLKDLLPHLTAQNATKRHKLSEVRLDCPVGNVGKIIGAPANYRKHVAEARADAAIHHGKDIKTIDSLGVFLKASSSLVGQAEGIAVPKTERRIDHEVELSVIIGQRTSNIAEDRALECVAGYSIGLDITVRGTEDRSYRKSLDTFSVLGPWLVTPDEFGDPEAVDLFAIAGNEDLGGGLSAGFWLEGGLSPDSGAGSHHEHEQPAHRRGPRGRRRPGLHARSSCA
jgi:2-keto-4-pentenoate hydratase/2-oxohepta-3-ene-1,7-dioic acid hydratase in catechol pathway